MIITINFFLGRALLAFSEPLRVLKRSTLIAPTKLLIYDCDSRSTFVYNAQPFLLIATHSTWYFP